MSYGIEKVQGMWYIFKENEKYWLNKNKQWDRKEKRAGIRDMSKAQALLLKK